MNKTMLTQITAGNLQLGDRISHLGQLWQVASTPKSTRQGKQFDVLSLTDNSKKTVIFEPRWRFDLL